MSQFDPNYREMRAKRFADTVLGIMRDFVPQKRDVVRLMWDCLYELGYRTNAEIIYVPPECDTMSKLELEQWRLNLSMKKIGLDSLGNPFDHVVKPGEG